MDIGSDYPVPGHCLPRIFHVDMHVAKVYNMIQSDLATHRSFFSYSPWGYEIIVSILLMRDFLA